MQTPRWSIWIPALTAKHDVPYGQPTGCWRLNTPPTTWMHINTLRPRHNDRHFADDTFKYIFLDENVIISTKISLNFVPKGPIDNIPALGQIMAWRRPGDKPLSEPMMVRLPTHICVTRPQWVNLKHWLEATPIQWNLDHMKFHVQINFLCEKLI